jgi:hypothetical protein
MYDNLYSYMPPVNSKCIQQQNDYICRGVCRYQQRLMDVETSRIVTYETNVSQTALGNFFLRDNDSLVGYSAV